MASFTLIRRIDGLIYQFRPDANTPRRFMRADRPALAITWGNALGWVMRDPVSGALTGRVWDVVPADQGDLPPAGCWVTAKADKSYVYDLHYDEGGSGA